MKQVIQLFALLSCFPILGQGNLEEILDKHFEGIGQDQWDQIDDVTIAGRWVDADYHGYGIDLLYKRPEKIRIEGGYEGRKFIEAFDGQQAWILAPWKKEYAVQPMAFMEKLILQNSFSLGSPIHKIKDEVIFNGLVDYKGTVYLTLVHEYPMGKETFKRTFYLDRKTCQLQLETYVWQDGSLEKNYDKYRDYGPLSVPVAVQFSAEELEKELVFDEVFMGLGIKDQRFRQPIGQ